MSKRALRRHHRERMVARARRVTRRWFHSYSPNQFTWIRGQGPVYQPHSIDHTQADRAAVRLADHLQNCSCPACGNPRRYPAGTTRGVLTRQERLAALALREWLDDLV